MKHFKIEEFIHSATATQFHINNTPSAKIIQNIEILIEKVLSPARERYGKPIYINSGYRCPELNQRVGGAKHSYHLQGRAADLNTRCGENQILFDILKTLPHKELIWEQSSKWIHVAY